MYCPKCGKQFDDGARFCKYCGTPTPEYSAAPGARAVPKYSATPSVSKPETPDAYHKLGGGLVVISYGRLIGSILELVVCLVAAVYTACFEYKGLHAIFVGLKNFFRAANSRSITFYGIQSYGSMLVTILYGFLLCGSIVLYRKTKEKKANGIVFYQVISVIISCIAIAGFAAGCFLMHDIVKLITTAQLRQIVPIAAATIWLILDVLISSLVFSIYFRTSERAKIYFGTRQ